LALSTSASTPDASKRFEFDFEFDFAFDFASEFAVDFEFDLGALFPGSSTLLTLTSFTDWTGGIYCYRNN
jgi:hypothetical protein